MVEKFWCKISFLCVVWVAVKCILWYLKGTISFGLHINCGSSLSLHGFINADWASSINDHKFIEACLVFFDTTLVSWKFNKLLIVARLSIKVEYKTLANDTAEVLWLRYLLLDLCLCPSYVIIIWCNNLDAIHLSVNLIFHARKKVEYHFIYDRVVKKDIQIRFVSSKDQLVNVLTKLLSHFFFIHLQSRFM